MRGPTAALPPRLGPRGRTESDPPPKCRQVAGGNENADACGVGCGLLWGYDTFGSDRYLDSFLTPMLRFLNIKHANFVCAIFFG